MKGFRNWFGQIGLSVLGGLLLISPVMSQPPSSKNAKITAQGGDKAESSSRLPNALSELTEDQKKELVRKNEVAKKLAEIFLKSGVWTWDDIRSTSDIVSFAHYLPDDAVKMAKWDAEKKDYTDEIYTISGAEYRYNLALMRGYGNYKTLDAEAQKLVNKEVFGQETRPNKDTQSFVDGLHKCLDIQRVVNAEYSARPLGTEDKSEVNQQTITNDR